MEVSKTHTQPGYREARTGTKKYYVAGNGYRMTAKGEYEHNTVLPKRVGYWVDHINGNRLDNRPENLRYVTPQQNAFNAKPHGKTGLKNVHVDRLGILSKPYKVQIGLSKNYHFGRFATLEEAAYVADQVMLQVHGEYGQYNYEW